MKNAELLHIIEYVDRLVEELKALPPMSEEQKQLLDKKFRLEFNYNSNHIEGNTLTYDDTKLLLLFDETSGAHPVRDLEEMKASDAAFKMIQQNARENERPLTEVFIKELNQILLVRPYWKDAITMDGQATKRQIVIGDYKKHPNSVRLSNGEIFHYTPPEETPLMMADLLEWLREEEGAKKLHPLELAAQLHYKFVKIHPFDDGNGRIARLLMNYILLRSELSPVIVKSNDKSRYLSALHHADNGNLDAFSIYIGNQLIWSLELSIKAAKGESLEETEDWKKRTELLKKRFADKDSIKVIKSVEVIKDTINTKIHPFLFKVSEALEEFNDLFLSKQFAFFLKGNAKSMGEGTALSAEMVRDYFQDHYLVKLYFDDFRKDPDTPISIDISLAFKFFRTKYELAINDKSVLNRLYHQEFGESEKEEVVNTIGRIVIDNLENFFNKM